MSEFENAEHYKEKLRENLAIISNLLDLYTQVYTETQNCNENLQALLVQLSANVQTGLAFFESIQDNLSAEQKVTLVDFASSQARSTEQLFEIFKAYKNVEEGLGNSISTISPQIMKFAKT